MLCLPDSVDLAMTKIKDAIANHSDFRHQAFNRTAFFVDTFGPRLWGSENLELSINWVKEELEKARRRREERMLEQQMWEEEKVRMARDADPQYFEDMIFLDGKIAPVQMVITLDTEYGKVKVRLITSYWASRLKVAVRIGQRVRMTPKKSAGGIAVPMFTPA